jgi:hypothetical protein
MMSHRRSTLLSLVALAGLFLGSRAGAAELAVCAEHASGATSDGQKVTICSKTFSEPPFVHLPGDDISSAVKTIHGVVDLDIAQGRDSRAWTISAARFIDRNLKSYTLANKDGSPMTEASPLMKSNFLPSNRVHFLVYEAKGTFSGSTFRIDSLRPVVMVTGRALDERFLGAWEGTMSLYLGKEGDNDVWSVDQNAKVRLEFLSLTPHDNMSEIAPKLTPPLPDGTRFKALGGVANAVQSVKLSTGECIPSLVSLGDKNPLFIASDYRFTLWRFPVMHSAYSRDYHVVNDYPRDLYPATLGMASTHNFRLENYISPATKPAELTFKLHGNPVRQMTMQVRPVKGGGQPCTR